MSEQGLAHILALLGEAGKLRADNALYMHCRQLVLSTPKELFAEVPFALALLLRGLRSAGVADEEVHRHLAGAVEPMNTRHVNDKMLLDLLEGFEALDALHKQSRILSKAASNARPLDQVYRRDMSNDRSEWLRRVTRDLKLKAAYMPLNKWTPNMLAKFAWCARRSTGEDPGVVLPGEDFVLQTERDADAEFEAYVSRALINTDPEALDGKSAAALLAYHARTDHAVGELQQRQDRLVLAYVADALAKYVDASLIAISDWVTILQAATQLRRPMLEVGADEAEDAAQAQEAAEEEAALKELFEKAGTHLLKERLVLRQGQAAAAGARRDDGAAAGAGAEVSMAESLSLLTSFARHPATAPPGDCTGFSMYTFPKSVATRATPDGEDADVSFVFLLWIFFCGHQVLESLAALVATSPSASLAAAPGLLARLSSLLPALWSAKRGSAADKLLQIFAEALAKVAYATYLYIYIYI